VQLIGRVPTLVRLLQDQVGQLILLLQEHLPAEDVSKVRDLVGAKLAEALTWLAGLVQGVITSSFAILNIVSLVVVTPIVSFFLLRDWEKMVAQIDSNLPRQSLELPPLNAARQTRSPFTNVHHSAVAPVKAKQGHQTIWQLRVAKMGLECQPVARPRRGRLSLRRQATDFPRAMCSNHHRRENLVCLSRRPFDCGNSAVAVRFKIRTPRRLNQCCADFGRPLDQQRIEPLSRQCPPPCRSGSRPRQPRTANPESRARRRA